MVAFLDGNDSAALVLPDRLPTQVPEADSYET
jgi:hypothetical protein